MYYVPEDCWDEVVPISKPNRVKQGLYISDCEAAECKESLKKENITHILNLVGGKAPYPEVSLHSFVLRWEL